MSQLNPDRVSCQLSVSNLLFGRVTPRRGLQLVSSLTTWLPRDRALAGPDVALTGAEQRVDRPTTNSSMEELLRLYPLKDSTSASRSFSLDDKTVASASHYRTVRLWDAGDGYHSADCCNSPHTSYACTPVCSLTLISLYTVACLLSSHVSPQR